jgi:AraC family transcriptional regulator
MFETTDDEWVPPVGLVREMQVMPQEELGRGTPIGPENWSQIVPFEPCAVSDRLGWVGLRAFRYRAAPASEFALPAMTRHTLFLVTRPPEELDLLYEGVKRHRPAPAGAVSLVPAGIPVEWRWRGHKDSFHVHLEPGLVARVAALAFDLDPGRLTLPPLDAVDLPQLRAAMLALDAELTAGGLGGPLAAESLANLVAVHLLRHVLAPRQPARRRYGTLPRARLRAVVEYVEEHLDANPTLEAMAALARLSPNYFASQFKRATGLPPHQYVILRRVERARQVLQTEGDFALAEIAARAGFADQSQFSHHFKRLIGVTPGQFQTRVRIDEKA